MVREAPAGAQNEGRRGPARPAQQAPSPDRNSLPIRKGSSRASTLKESLQIWVRQPAWCKLTESMVDTSTELRCGRNTSRTNWTLFAPHLRAPGGAPRAAKNCFQETASSVDRVNGVRQNRSRTTLIAS